MSARLLLIRHAAIEEARGGALLVGSSDVPAGRQGLLELERLAGVLSAYMPGAWYCSPMLRARQTMARLDELTPKTQDTVVDERLREIDFGRWEMKSFSEIAEQDQDMLEGWCEYLHFVFPGGESVAAFCARVAEMLADLRAASHREVAVVSHGGIIRTMICLALGLSPKNYLLFDVRPGTMSVLDLHADGATLAALNL